MKSLGFNGKVNYGNIDNLISTQSEVSDKLIDIGIHYAEAWINESNKVLIKLEKIKMDITSDIFGKTDYIEEINNFIESLASRYLSIIKNIKTSKYIEKEHLVELGPFMNNRYLEIKILKDLKFSINNKEEQINQSSDNVELLSKIEIIKTLDGIISLCNSNIYIYEQSKKANIIPMIDKIISNTKFQISMDVKYNGLTKKNATKNYRMWANGMFSICDIYKDIINFTVGTSTRMPVLNIDLCKISFKYIDESLKEYDRELDLDKSNILLTYQPS